MDGLDECGVEFKENLKGLYCRQKTEKSFCEFIAGLFYAYVFDWQTCGNSLIHGTA